MSLDRFVQSLDAMLEEARALLSSADSADALETLRVRFTGAKSGELKTVQKGMGQIAPEDRPAAGKRFNEVRDALQHLLDEAGNRLGSASKSKTTRIATDPTLPGLRPRVGVVHPITQTIEHLKEIMGRLGFNVAEGPEIEDEWHNFVALNIPDDHPARDPLDNFYLATAKASGAASPNSETAPQRLLRSQTSTVQIRVMETEPLPMRIISLGRVYR
nr:phenylalanine--tRNA ligase subunit alpha [Pirellula sp.]